MLVLAFLYGLFPFSSSVPSLSSSFFYVLLTGEARDELKAFGHSLAIYSYEIIEYLTFNSNNKPFPV